MEKYIMEYIFQVKINPHPMESHNDMRNTIQSMTRPVDVVRVESTDGATTYTAVGTWVSMSSMSVWFQAAELAEELTGLFADRFVYVSVEYLHPHRGASRIRFE